MIGKDGLYTKDRDTVLALAFADCVPVFFSAPGHSIVGIVHAGWKGSVLGIARDMVELWKQDEGIPVEDIKVWIGPSIQQCCYEVDERVISNVDKVADSRYSPYTRKDSEDKFMLSLQRLNQQLILQTGIPEKNIQVSDHCTSCEVSTFFSHRKEKGQTGRMLGFIKLL